MPEVSTLTQAQTTAEILQEKIRSRSARVGIVGLGCVGLPLAVEFARAGFEVTGIDVSQTKTDRVNIGDSVRRRRAWRHPETSGRVREIARHFRFFSRTRPRHHQYL